MNEANANGFDGSQQDVSPEQELKSKTQLKQEAELLKKLGTDLVQLPQATLMQFPLDQELLDAILLAARINKKKDGYRRQLQLIGKMMRQRDPEPIIQALEKLRAPHLAATQFFHKLEQYRDWVLTGDTGIQQLLDEHPNLDRQKLRQLQRQAIKQSQNNKPAAAAREIFQYLKQHIEE